MQDAPSLRLIDVHRALADPATTEASRRQDTAARAAARHDLDAYGAELVTLFERATRASR